MAYSTDGRSIASFRERTEKTASKMVGVSFLTFVCKLCKEVRPVKGRKSNGYKNGFKCADCSAKATSAA